MAEDTTFSLLESHPDEYWAGKPPDDLLPELTHRIEKHFQGFESNPFMPQILRNWCYFHEIFKDTGNLSIVGGALLRMGPQGERVFGSLGHLRNILEHLYILTVRDRPAPKCRATNQDEKNIQDAQIADGLLEEHLRDKRGEVNLYRTAREALVLTEGYLQLDWDDKAGDEVVGDPYQMQVVREGDLKTTNPSLFDVVRDPGIKTWPPQWYCCRTMENRYDLAALHPEKRSEILSSTEPKSWEWNLWESDEPTDQAPVWTFWHDRTPALPEGRRYRFMAGTWIDDGDLPKWWRRSPVFRCCPSEIVLDCRGYSPGFSLQGPQEALNMVLSNIITNFENFGLSNIWQHPETSMSSAVNRGLRVIKSEIKPEPVNFLNNPGEAYKFLEVLVAQTEILSGVNSVRRGHPDRSYESGKAMSVIEGKAIEFASQLVQSYYQLLEDYCSAVVYVLSEKLNEEKPHQVAVAGRSGRSMRSYNRKTLQSVQGVYVESMNPVMNTAAYRLELAEKYIDKGWVHTPEEIITVLNSGRIEPLLKADQAQLSCIAKENDALQDGQICPVLKTDFHSLHIREQAALLSTPEVRKDPNLSSNVLGHVLVHIGMLYLPDVKELQMALGFPAPAMPQLAPGVLAGIPDPYKQNFTETDLQSFGALPPSPAPPTREGGGMGKQMAEKTGVPL